MILIGKQSDVLCCSAQNGGKTLFCAFVFRYIFAYRRKNKEEELVVICNFFDQTVPCHMEELGDSWKLLICNYKEIEQSLVLRPYKARMY